MHLFLTKVAVKSWIYPKAFGTTVIYSSDLCTYNATYFQTLYVARNGDHLPTVSAARRNFAPQCMKLFGN